ncbi:MAG: DUF739 family protein [Clostridiales bacterium]|nr:DUF739 family protein [Clostridiales bacterium]
MYNYSNLLGKMRSSGMTQEAIANAVGKNVATINQKLNGKSYFTQTEIDKICECLSINPNEIPKYFFTH